MNVNCDKNRTKTRIAVYLIGLKNEMILLGKRKNTAHLNGYWSLPAGHVYEFESCFDVLIREAHEECGIVLTRNELELKGIVHHWSKPYDYVDFVFVADVGQQNIVNCEPEKCESLQFFSKQDALQIVHPYIAHLIEQSLCAKNSWVDEVGFK